MKFDRTVEILRGVMERGDSAVVFSYLLDPLEVLRNRCLQELEGISVLTLHGAMTQEERQDCIKVFANSDRSSILLASLRAAGESLTLTVANHVILFNQWWNPSSNNQAIDRVRRIGQTGKVTVYRFTCRNTVEDSLAKLLAEKGQLFDQVIGKLERGTVDKATAELDFLVEN